MNNKKRKKQNNRPKVQKLFRRQKNCYYCGVKLKMAKPGVSGCDQHKDIATLEHLYSKLDIRRLLSVKAVLACALCNHSRAEREFDLIYNNGTYSMKYDHNNSNGLLVKFLNREINSIII